ncbi:MAG: helix-turn-helix domain-containing protein [Lachnospiraceae bacterium]
MKFNFPDGSRNLIGDKIKQLRTDNKMSQKDLAIKLQTSGCEISDLTILRIEKGIRLVTDFELLAFCELFGISPNEILDYKSSK